MDISIRHHLNQVTTENLREWRDCTDDIIVYASYKGIKIGINQYGDWVVLDNGVHLFEQNIQGAVDKYHELVKANQ